MTEVFPVLASVVGAVIVGIRRIFYVFQGSTDVSVGALELKFADGRAVVLDSGGDGESLVTSALRWEDPFLVRPMTPENEEFIAESGKWTAFDVSENSDYMVFIGARIEDIKPISIPDGKIIAVVFKTTAGDIKAAVEADDLYVSTFAIS